MISKEQIEKNILANRNRNSELLETLRKKNVPLDLPRLVEHHFWVWTKDDAALLSNALQEENNREVKIIQLPSEDGLVWSVELVVEQTPQDAADPVWVERVAFIASKFDALYDGWGTKIGACGA